MIQAVRECATIQVRFFSSVGTKLKLQTSSPKLNGAFGKSPIPLFYSDGQSDGRDYQHIQGKGQATNPESRPA